MIPQTTHTHIQLLQHADHLLPLKVRAQHRGEKQVPRKETQLLLAPVLPEGGEESGCAGERTVLVGLFVFLDVVDVVKVKNHDRFFSFSLPFSGLRAPISK